jgi:hypothetical protein
VVGGSWSLSWLNAVQSRVAQCWYIPLDILSLSTVSSHVVVFPLLLSVTSLSLFFVGALVPCTPLLGS